MRFALRGFFLVPWLSIDRRTLSSVVPSAPDISLRVKERQMVQKRFRTYLGGNRFQTAEQGGTSE